MKAIMLSIKPKYVSMILNKTKTIEVRKRFPKDYRGWVYLYCTKDKNRLLQMDYVDEDNVNAKLEKDCTNEDLENSCNILNGKVVACFYCDNVEEIKLDYKYNELHNVVEKQWFYTQSLKDCELYNKSCLTKEEIYKYLNCYGGNKCKGYAVHISQLEIFDKPKELWEFMSLKSYAQYERDLNQAYEDDEETMSRIYEGIANEYECANCVELTEMSKGYYGLTKAPQSYMFVEVNEND